MAGPAITGPDLRAIIERFQVHGDLRDVVPWGTGHIHATYRSAFVAEGRVHRFIHQRINDRVFPDVAGLMENVVRVTGHVASKVRSAGGDVERETLALVPTRDGASHFVTEQHGSWRTYRFIEGTVTHETASSQDVIHEAARAFGRFQAMLADLPAPRLREVIPGFHDTPARLAALREAVLRDRAGRAASAAGEIAFAERRASSVSRLLDLQASGVIPERITHNDTKLNNVLFDASSGRALCVVDLDTVMPGLAAHDFGDAVRLGACAAAEDEPDPSRVELDLGLFEALAAGTLDATADLLVPAEVEALPLGAVLMTFECGMRFLTDYLDGDRYFRVRHELQNLDRCRRHWRLVEDMENNMEEMTKAVRRHGRKSSC